MVEQAEGGMRFDLEKDHRVHRVCPAKGSNDSRGWSSWGGPSGLPFRSPVTTPYFYLAFRAGEEIRTLDVNLGKVA